MARADRIAGILLLLFAAFVIVEARALPLWVANAPGPGFLPFWLGVLLACAAGVMLARTILVDRADTTHEPEAATLPDRAAALQVAVVVGLTAAAAILTSIIGLVLASALFMGATLAYLRPGRARANWTAALITPLVVWLLFARWLGVPLPAGPLGF